MNRIVWKNFALSKEAISDIDRKADARTCIRTKVKNNTFTCDETIQVQFAFVRFSKSGFLLIPVLECHFAIEVNTSCMSRRKRIPYCKHSKSTENYEKLVNYAIIDRKKLHKGIKYIGLLIYEIYVKLFHVIIIRN